MNLNRKLKILLKLYFLNKKKYFTNFIKLINFSKKNLNIINYDILYFYFKNFNINDLKKILKILKKFKIHVLKEIPDKDNILYKNLYNNFINKNYFKDDFKNFKNIEKIMKKIFSLFKKNIFIFIFFLKNDKNFFKKLFRINFLKNLFFKKFRNLNLNDLDVNNINFYFNIKNFKKIFYKPIVFFYKILKKNKKKYKNISIKIIKEKFNLIKKFNIKFYNYIYKLSKKIFKEINNIRLKIYDSIINLSNIDFINFNFFFLKNNSNLNWILNIVNLTEFDIKFKKNFFKFIKKKEKILKKIEIKYSTKIDDIFKFFYILDVENLKISIIKEELINANVFLVKNLTRKYFKKNIYKDIFQEGIIGLNKSIINYDYRFKIFFKSFSILFIKQNISKYFYKNNNLLKIPLYLTTLIKKINKEKKIYYKIYKEKPSFKYLSKKLNISEKRIKKLINLYKNPKSIDTKFKENKKNYEFIKEEKELKSENFILEKDEKEILIKNLKNTLDENSLKILFMRFGMEFYEKSTLSKIGEKLNLSKERIRQIQNNIFKKLRHPSKIKLFKKIFSIKN